jgi:hypothetical protein
LLYLHHVVRRVPFHTLPPRMRFSIVRARPDLGHLQISTRAVQFIHQFRPFVFWGACFTRCQTVTASSRRHSSSEARLPSRIRRSHRESGQGLPGNDRAARNRASAVCAHLPGAFDPTAVRAWFGTALSLSAVTLERPPLL